LIELDIGTNNGADLAFAIRVPSATELIAIVAVASEATKAANSTKTSESSAKAS
jgi:hypothetical protein